ncbi:MAG: LacI family DNA-binding transcriptional regulator, partial [Nitrososphaerales archaeon]
GLSLTTASKALNGRDRISEVTRRRVLRAAKELSYAPNLVAKSLARGRSSIIGVLLRDPVVHRFAMPIVNGAQSVLEQRDTSAIIADARGVVERFTDLAIMLRQRTVEGCSSSATTRAQLRRSPHRSTPRASKPRVLRAIRGMSCISWTTSLGPSLSTIWSTAAAGGQLISLALSTHAQWSNVS